MLEREGWVISGWMAASVEYVTGFPLVVLYKGTVTGRDTVQISVFSEVS